LTLPGLRFSGTSRLPGALFCMLKDPRKKAVAARLQKFFRDLKKQVTEGVEDLWRKAETRSSGKQSEPGERDGE
jgi:hypothetical protein